MKITQLRNATVILEIGESRILVDPMLAPQGALPPLKFVGGRRRNPLVALPEAASAMLDTVTHCLITHCQKGHFDHLDRSGKRWLRERNIPVICTPHDASYLKERGLNVIPLPDNHHDPVPFLGGSISTFPCVHGTGLVGRFMEHGVGYLIEIPGEPSLYLSGDTILTPELQEFLARRQPQVSLVPAGGARFDLGSEIIMGIDDAIEVVRTVTGVVVANHMEALGHCPVTRTELADAARRAGVAERLHVPADGETLAF